MVVICFYMIASHDKSHSHKASIQNIQHISNDDELYTTHNYDMSYNSHNLNISDSRNHDMFHDFYDQASFTIEIP